MLKKYSELSKVDVTPYCDEKIVNKDGDTVSYLGWAKCVDLLHEQGAEVVYFTPLINEETGSTLFSTKETFGTGTKTNKCYEVRVKITIDELEFVQHYPVIQGKYAVSSNNIDQFIVDYAQKRAFVKGVAIRTGLGLSLWFKEDSGTEEALTKTSAIGYIEKVQKYTQELFSQLLVDGFTQEQIAEELKLANKEVLRSKFAQFDDIKSFISALFALDKENRE